MHRYDYIPDAVEQEQGINSRKYEFFKPEWKVDKNGKVIKPEEADKVPIFECNTCSYKTFNEDEIKEHILTHKKGVKNERSGDDKERKR